MKKIVALLLCLVLAAVSLAVFAEGESDKAYVVGKGKLIVGITDFEPMDFKDENGEWIGFDADLARAFAEYLGVEIEFQEIDWDNKVLELDSKNIDCVWNGMTLTDEVLAAMECSQPYMNNAQVVVLPMSRIPEFTTVEDLASLVFAVEAGSAGEEEIDALGYQMNAVQNQAAALMEVKAGTSDAAVIDALMAAAMIGEGTSYEDLGYTLPLNSEVYGVGFRTGSDLAAELDAFLAAAAEEGALQALAEAYGVQAALIAE
ncbi:MAG: transporter substrate-binding domain-containing protein [Clostridia bacterium]|nr:transporter substrate-binding domain-containing protein [Clostridia bacterium]